METFSLSFESTQSKTQYGTKINCTEVRKKKVMVIKNVMQLFRCLFVPLTSSSQPLIGLPEIIEMC